MRCFWALTFVLLLASCGPAERNLRPLEAPTAAVLVTAAPWQQFQNSDFFIQYPAAWSAKPTAGALHFFDAQGDLAGTVKTGAAATLWPEGLQPFEETLAEYSSIVETIMEADAGVDTEYPQEMSVQGTVMIDDEPATVLVLVILHEGQAAVISAQLTPETGRPTIEAMMHSFRFLIQGAS